jgi:hypothetical protein
MHVGIGGVGMRFQRNGILHWIVSIGVFRVPLSLTEKAMENFWFVIGNPPLGPPPCWSGCLAMPTLLKWLLGNGHWKKCSEWILIVEVRGLHNENSFTALFFSAHYQAATSARGHEVEGPREDFLWPISSFPWLFQRERVEPWTPLIDGPNN